MGIKQYVAVVLITVIACSSITFNILQNRDIEELEGVVEGNELTIGEQEVISNDLEREVNELEEVVEELEEEIEDLEKEVTKR